MPKAYAEETQALTVAEFLNLSFSSVQSLAGLKGKVNEGKVLRFGETGSEEDTTEPTPELLYKFFVAPILKKAYVFARVASSSSG